MGESKKGSRDYYMPQEYYEEPQEYTEPVGEDQWLTEYVQPRESEECQEYFDTPQSSADDAIVKDPGRRGKIRKMVYLLTSAVAAVTVAQAAIPEQTMTMIPVGQYSNIGYSNGGVIPVEDRDGWHLLNMEGESLHDMGGNGKLVSHPNEDGRTVFLKNPNKLYITDDQGNEIWEYRDGDLFDLEAGHWSAAYVTDQNMVLVSLQDTGYSTFLDGKGKVLLPDAEPLRLCACAEFSEGYGLYLDEDTDEVYRLDAKGNSELVCHAPNIRAIMSPYADDSFLYLDTLNWTFVHYDVKTGEHRKFTSIDYEKISAYTGIPVSAHKNVDRFLLQPVGYGYLMDLKSYYQNSATLHHKGTYVCGSYRIEGTQDNEHIDVLFDLAQMSDDNPMGIVTWYDEIWFDNSPYLLAWQDGEYFYIDWEGSIVSRKYQKATTFSEQGYALAMDQEGWAYVLDENLKQVERIAGVTDLEIQARGDILLVTCDKEQFVCFYGTKE